MSEHSQQCECPKCNKDGVNSVNQSTGTIYCEKCGERTNGLFAGDISVDIKPDKKLGLLDKAVSECFTTHKGIDYE
jgi:hypothetical protein